MRLEDYNQSAIEYSMQLLERLKESRQNSKSTNTKTTKQPVNYSFRKVSAAIARAKNVNQASNALTSANSALSALRRKSASGQYNDDELQNCLKPWPKRWYRSLPAKKCRIYGVNRRWKVMIKEQCIGSKTKPDRR